MGLGDRIHDSILSWSEEWKDKIRGWFAHAVVDSFSDFFDFLEPDVRSEVTPMINRLLEIPELPDDIKSIFNKAKEQPQAVQLAFLLPMAIGMLAGAGIGMAQPVMRWGQYKVDRRVHSNRIDPNILIRALWRGFTTEDYFDDVLTDLGFSTKDINILKDVAKFYPSPQDLVNWQAKEVYEPTMRSKYGLDAELDELKKDAFYKAGIDDEQIGNYWAAHWQHPALNVVYSLLHRGLITEQDVYSYYRLVEVPPFWRDGLTEISWDLPNRIELRMMARYGLVDKSFLIEQLKKVGLAEEYRDVAADMMLVMGIRTDISTRYSKGWLDAEGVKSELSAAGLSQQIQDRLYQWIVKNTNPDRTVKERELTKTDIYRGVKKNIISRAEGQQLLQAMGYDANESKFILDLNAPVDQEQEVVKERELTKTDVLKGLKVGEIDQAEAISRLMNIRYSQADAEYLVNITLRTMEEIPEERQRELTKADIVKGVKNGVITGEEGYIMLQDIGYTPEDSNFILTVNVTAEQGSPDGYGEFRQMVNNYRESIGLPVKAVSDDVVIAERAVKAAQAALDKAKEIKLEKKRITELEAALEAAKISYHQVLQPNQEEG